MKFTAIATSMLVASASAFAPVSKSSSASTALNVGQQYGNMGPPSAPMVGGSAPSGGFEMFSPDIPMKRIEGGGTVRTWDIPPETERLQYVLETNGRPLKAKVELYVKRIE
jgi:hypothetical protein